MPTFNLACGQNILRSLGDDLLRPRDFPWRPNGAWGAGRRKQTRRGVPQSRSHPFSARDGNAVQPDPRSTALIFRQPSHALRSAAGKGERRVVRPFYGRWSSKNGSTTATLLATWPFRGKEWILMAALRAGVRNLLDHKKRLAQPIIPAVRPGFPRSTLPDFLQKRIVIGSARFAARSRSHHSSPLCPGAGNLSIARGRVIQRIAVPSCPPFCLDEFIGTVRGTSAPRMEQLGPLGLPGDRCWSISSSAVLRFGKHPSSCFLEGLSVCGALDISPSCGSWELLARPHEDRCCPAASFQAGKARSILFPVRRFACIPYCASGILPTGEISPPYCGLC